MLFSILRGGASFFDTLLLLATFFFAIIFALVVHELAHGWVAHRCGDDTAQKAGRLTFNPAKHITPLGLVAFLLAGFGWAKSVQVNPYNFYNYKRGLFWTSIAGVLVNFVVAFICSFCCLGLLKIGNMDSLFIQTVYNCLFFSVLVNTALVVFNLLPLQPLDGYNILYSLTKSGNRVVTWLQRNSFIILIIVVLFGSVITTPIMNSIMGFFDWFWNLII
jgi:Zn-dependent protease